MILRNISSQGVFLFAKVFSTGAAKTGDAANITGGYSLDGTDHVGFTTANPAEMSGGVYWQPLSQAETDGNAYAYRWASSTSGVVIEPIMGFTGQVQLADGVAHGGSPYSSTATFAMKQIVLNCDNDDAFSCNSSHGAGIYVYSNFSHAAQFVTASSGSAALALRGNNNGCAGLVIQPTGADAVTITGDFELATGGGNGIVIVANGTGTKAILLSADTTTDTFAIAAGAGTPINVFNTNGGVSIDLTQAVPNSNIAQTVGDCLLAARAQGFGKWVLSGTSLTLYASDGTTVVRTFTLDSSTAPTTRT